MFHGFGIGLGPASARKKDSSQSESDSTSVGINEEIRKTAKFHEYLPQWDTASNYPHLGFFKHDNMGNKADPSFPFLLPRLGGIYKDINSGVQISESNNNGKDELALLVAQRGVVVFLDQDWTSKGPSFLTEFGRYFGKLHIHQTSGAPEGFPESHVTFTKPGSFDFQKPGTRNNHVYWHSDVSYELQPPGTTFFAVLEGPDSGGDTLFADTVEAYKRLSPEFQQRSQGLHVLHSAVQQAHDLALQGGTLRRSASEHIHPLIRVHPVTKEKAIYLNRVFSRRIVELRGEESEYLLNFLYKHIESAHDLQLRAN